MNNRITIQSIEKIIDTVYQAAKNGSCETCQWCLVNEYEFIKGLGYSHYCAIQGNVNPIDFTDEALKQAAYPYGPCEYHGDWQNKDDITGKTESIPYCMAYKEKKSEISENDIHGGRHPSILSHYVFMDDLRRAADLIQSIKEIENGALQILLNKLKELMENVPASP